MESLNFYVHSLKRIKTVSREEEKSLYEMLSGSKEEREFAINELVNANLLLVVKIANEYKNSSMEIEDMIEEGNLGLIHGAERFIPNSGAKFNTYASFWIRRYILFALDTKSRTIRIPRSTVQALYRKRRKGEDSSSGYETVSLNAEVDGTNKEFMSAIEGSLSSGEQDERIDFIENAFYELTGREKEVIRKRFFDKMRYKNIGEHLGVTLERVRQIEKIALSKMRKSINKRIDMSIATVEKCT